MAQSPAAFFSKADATDNGERGATGFRGFGNFSVDFLLVTGSGGGGENLLPTCVLCHVSRCRLRLEHVNSSVKRCRVVKDRIRLWKKGIRDLVMELCCALHNFRVRLTPWQPMI